MLYTFFYISSQNIKTVMSIRNFNSPDMMGVPLVGVPTPNIGDCTKTGKWSSPTMVQDCQSCIAGSTRDYPMFYCDGQCLSKYDLNGSCSLDSLVAKTKEQCSAPCKQVAAPSMSNVCQDRFDCNPGQICFQGNCVEGFGTQGPSYKPHHKKKKHKKGMFETSTLLLVVLSIVLLLIIIAIIYVSMNM